jgi:hypothetical protein
MATGSIAGTRAGSASNTSRRSGLGGDVKEQIPGAPGVPISLAVSHIDDTPVGRYNPFMSVHS